MCRRPQEVSTLYSQRVTIHPNSDKINETRALLVQRVKTTQATGQQVALAELVAGRHAPNSRSHCCSTTSRRSTPRASATSRTRHSRSSRSSSHPCCESRLLSNCSNSCCRCREWPRCRRPAVRSAKQSSAQRIRPRPDTGSHSQSAPACPGAAAHSFPPRNLGDLWFRRVPPAYIGVAVAPQQTTVPSVLPVVQ